MSHLDVTNHSLAVLVATVGAVMVASLLMNALCERIRLPSLAGHLLLGFVVASLDHWRPFLGGEGDAVFEFLGKLGVIALLFAVGVQSDLRGLLGQLRRAGPIWILNMAAAGALGYLAARHLLGFETIPSVVIGTALTATSVGVPTAVWEQRGAIDTDDGRLFVDVAELDDISGVVLMAVLFAFLPTLSNGHSAENGIDSLPIDAIIRTTSLLIAKLVALAAGCYIFARFLEQPLIRFFNRFERGPDPVISVTSIATIIAGVAGILGFSVAIGAFFAGLAFSRRRDEAMGPAFATLRSLFVPFFFIAVGLNIEPTMQVAGLTIGVLFLAASLGKLIGTVTPALPMLGTRRATLLGLSMVPRAEITMIIASQGLRLGDWAMPQRLYDAIIITSVLTCLAAPIGMRALLHEGKNTDGAPDD